MAKKIADCRLKFKTKGKSKMQKLSDLEVGKPFPAVWTDVNFNAEL
ncbi:MAG: hypothetical protein JJV92_04535 [Desulfosarcina sp.]|nr:hypothetical protein [Desulfobacterales bacterium]